MTTRITAQRSGASLFLIELIIAIGVFAAASAVCVQLFARASTVSRESSELSRATLCVQSAAESFKSTGGSLEATRALLGSGELSDGRLTVGYNRDWHPTLPAQSAPPVYLLTLVSSEAYGVVTADIAVSRFEKFACGEPIYHVQTGALAG